MKRIITITAFLVGLVSLTALAHGAGLINATIAPFRIFVNGIEKQYEKQIIQIDGSTYLPLRETAETLGMEVSWVAEGKKVDLSQEINGDDLFVFSIEPTDIYGNYWLYGYMDRKGNIRIKPQFREANNFSEGLASVQFRDKDGLWGYINTKGEIVIPFKYFEANDFKDGLAVVQSYTYEEGQEEVSRYFIDKNGDKASKGYYNMSNFHDGYAHVNLVDSGGSGFFIDRDGKEIREYDDVHGFYDGYAVVEKDGKCGLIDSSLHEVIECRYNRVISNYGTKGFIKIAKDATNGGDRKVGLMNIKEEVVIDFLYESLSNISEGLIAAELDGKWGYINLQGKTVIPFQFERVWDFSEGFAVVSVEGKGRGIIDRKGNYFISPQKDMSFRDCDRGLFKVFDRSKGYYEAYYIDKEGNKIIPH